MRKNRREYLFIGMIIILLVAAGCSPRSAPVQPQEDPVIEEEPVISVEDPMVEPLDFEEDMDEGDAPEGEEQDFSDQQVVRGEDGVRSDIPVIENAYKIQVSRAGYNINFQVDGTIDEVFSYYQEELARRGWQQMTASDSVSGPRGSLVRDKEDARLSMNFQENTIGGFVVVAIFLTDK
jgi:hypothetical protein